MSRRFSITITWMSYVRGFAAALLVVVTVVTGIQGAPQGFAGTRASIEAQNGWDAIRDKRHDDAAAAFDRALDAEPRDPSLHLGAGLAAYLLGQPTAAQHALERALGLAPSLRAASLLLADILYRASDIAGAIHVYEAALRHTPGEKTVLGRLEALRREAALHNEFLTSHRTHFTLLFEGGADASIAASAGEMLEAAYWQISTALAIYPERPITVVLYTQEQFRDITRSPSWAAGAYDGRIRLPVKGAGADLRELERVIAHEFTYALVQNVAPRGVPLWLHEGLAVMFEPDGAAWSRRELAKAPGRPPSARLAGSFESLSAPEARLAYGQGAALVGTLFEMGAPLAVGALLQDLARGDTFAAAFERRFFTPYTSFLAGLESAAAH